MTDPRKAIVQAGYDAIAERHLAWSQAIEGDPRDRVLNEIARRLHDGADVLDLGCGAGVPSTKQLAERFEVVGADILEEQLRLAPRQRACCDLHSQRPVRAGVRGRDLHRGVHD